METEIRQYAAEKLLRVLMFTLTLSAMSAFMFNIVMPQIREEFHLTVAEVSWISSAYALIYAIGAVVYGKLADSFKLKNLLTFGLLLFAGGSLIGLISQAYWTVLVGRCLQAAGAAVVPATANLIPVRYFAPERRGAAIGTAAVGLALGNALGPVVSSLIVSFVHWRWLFCLPLLILITIPFYRKYLGDEQGRPASLDWLGGGLLTVTVAMLLLGVTYGAWLFMAGGLLVLVFFIVRIRSAAEPFIQPRMFGNSKYTTGLLLVFLISGIGSSLPFLSPLLLANVHRLPSGWIGFAMVPAALASAFLGRKAGKLADARGNSFVFWLASALLTVCFVLLSTFTGASVLWVAIFFIFGNVGQSFILIAMSNTISTTLAKENVGVGMGILSLLNFIAAGMASGVYSRMVDLGATMRWNPLNFNTDSIVFSNIYLVLALMHLLILWIYSLRFGAKTSAAFGPSNIHHKT
ncbi:MFS transporter [Paenibacillus hamazuiensis]|uniref:MFS transporter n=1 Tax=Paenibacillus hamazuiensis TaxID=2936508 RepID=UPI00200DF746|nr:MFS transporter [Paenibacillus hamazuiensis]